MEDSCDETGSVVNRYVGQVITCQIFDRMGEGELFGMCACDVQNSRGDAITRQNPIESDLNTTTLGNNFSLKRLDE